MTLDRAFVFKAANIAVAVASVGICIAAALEAEKHVDRDAIYVAPVIGDNTFYFSTDELDTVARALYAYKIAYFSAGREPVSAGIITAAPRVIYTNSDFFELYNVRFAYGSGWRQGMEGERVAVVNESLAWQLFGNVDVTACKISLSGETYAIIGIIWQERVSKDAAVLYVPMNPASGDRCISSILMKTSDKLDAYNRLDAALADIGKSLADYYLTDVGQFIENISLKYRMLVFVVGIYVAATIVINSYKLLRQKSGLHNWKNLLLLAGLFVLDAFFIVLMIRGIAFDALTPRGGSWIDGIVKMLTNGGFFPSREYLSEGLRAVTAQSARANAAFIAGLVGLFNFVFIHKPKGMAQKKDDT